MCSFSAGICPCEWESHASGTQLEQTASQYHETSGVFQHLSYNWISTQTHDDLKPENIIYFQPSAPSTAYTHGDSSDFADEQTLDTFQGSLETPEGLVHGPDMGPDAQACRYCLVEFSIGHTVSSLRHELALDLGQDVSRSSGSGRAPTGKPMPADPNEGGYFRCGSCICQKSAGRLPIALDDADLTEAPY